MLYAFCIKLIGIVCTQGLRDDSANKSRGNSIDNSQDKQDYSRRSTSTEHVHKKIKFSHNPFSMPQGNVNNLDLSKPLELKAYQYDIVCNGVELSSGAIRNHIPELMYKLFAIAGYNKKIVNEKFKGIISALSYGAPPHGGIAPGIDRIVMLLAEEKNIREVIMFPMNQNAQDLLMNAPSDISDEQLKELNLAIKKK